MEGTGHSGGDRCERRLSLVVEHVIAQEVNRVMCSSPEFTQVQTQPDDMLSSLLSGLDLTEGLLWCMMLPEAMLMIVVYAAFHATMRPEIHVDVYGLCC